MFARALIAAAALASAGHAAAQTAPPGRDDIVVTGSDERKSDWRRADADHLTAYSDGDQGELVRVTKSLERLHLLLQRLYRVDGAGSAALPLTVALVSPERFRDLDLHGNSGFAERFAGQLRYVATDDRPVLIVARGEQLIELNNSRRFHRDCDDLLAGSITPAGAMAACADLVPDHLPLPRSWESWLHSAYAQHFVRTYLPAAYPDWYLDGVGALFSSYAKAYDGTVDYARPPFGWEQILKSYGLIDVGAVLSGQVATGRRAAPWTPYHAGLLAHYFLFSKLSEKRAAQFRQYMTAVHQGVPLGQAAAVFGDFGKLQGEFFRYTDRTLPYARAAAPAAPLADPLVTRLTPASAAALEARLAIVGGGKPQRTADRLAALPPRADTLAATAEAACRGGRTDACLAAADRALALDTGDAAALTWRGVALLDAALAARTPVAPARAQLLRAIAADDTAAAPRLAYFRSFTAAGEAVPDDAMAGLAQVIRQAPAAVQPRVMLAEELQRRGQRELAERLLAPVRGMVAVQQAALAPAP